MGIIAGFLIGLIAGFIIGIWACMRSEKESVKNRVLVSKGKAYRLTEIKEQ